MYYLTNFQFKTLLSAFAILLVLSGCDISKRYIKVRDKALKSGVVIPKDTVTITNSDTITTIVTKNDTTIITNTVTKTVQLEPIIEVKTRWQTKYETKYKYKTVKVENKAMIDSLRQVLKIERQATKQIKAENRTSKWWLWLLIGVVVGWFSKYFLKLRQLI